MYKKYVPPVVTIGVPVYNGGAMLAGALDSLLSQSMKDFEIVISDNGSTDETAEVCQKYAALDDRVRYVRHEENHGAWWNFVFLLSHVQGRFFMWAADDDRWHESFLDELLGTFVEGSVMTYGCVQGVDEKGQVVGELGDFNLENGFVRMPRYLFLNPWDGKANLIYGLYRTHAVKQYCFNPHREGELFGFDMHFVYYMLQLGGFTFSPSAMMYKLVPSTNSDHEATSIIPRLFLVPLLGHLMRYVQFSKKWWLKLFTIALLPAIYLKMLVANFVRIINQLSR